jgi:hypothetical protein
MLSEEDDVGGGGGPSSSPLIQWVPQKKGAMSSPSASGKADTACAGVARELRGRRLGLLRDRHVVFRCLGVNPGVVQVQRRHVRVSVVPHPSLQQWSPYDRPIFRRCT